MTDYLQLARERAAGAPPSDAANPYMGIAQENRRRQETQLRGIVERALKDDPELAAERQRLSQTSGLPLSVVERNLDEIRRKEAARALDIARMMRDSPVLSRQLLDPSFTTVAQDDIGVLGQIERFARDLGGAAKAGVFRASRGAAGTFQAGLELVAPVLDPLESVTAIGGNPLRRLAEGFALQGAAAGRTAEAARPRTDGVLGAGFFGGVESLTQNLLALPMAFLPGGQGAALTMMTAGAGGGAYQDAREKGLPMSQALPFAASQAAIEYATEKLPLGALLKDVRAGAGFLQILGRQIALEVPGEQIATVLQDLNEWAILNPDKPFSAYLEERPSAAAQTLIATIVGTGGNVAVVKGLESVMSRLAADGANMQRAGLAGQALQRAFELAGQSALRERSPEQFRALMGQMSGDAKLYVDGEVLNQLPPEALAQLPAAVRDRIPLAAATGDMVEIAVADALTVAPGTPLAETLTQNARTSPEAPSLREAEEAGQQAQVYLQQEAERVIQQAADQAAARASQEAVKQNIKQQLAATGRFRDAVNEGYATWAAAFYTAYGSRLGLTPEQFYQRYPLRVLGAPVGQQTGVLNAGERSVVNNMTAAQIQAEITDLMPRVQQAYEAGNAPLAERLDARLETLMDALDANLAELEEDTLTPADLLNPLLAAKIQEGEQGDTEADVVRDLANRWRDMQARQGDSQAEQAAEIKAVLDDYAFRHGGLREGLSDTEVLDAARDAYDAVYGRQERQRERLRAQPGGVLNQDAPTETLQGDPVEPSDDVAAIVQSEIPDSVDAGATLENTLQLAKGKVWQKGRDLKLAMQEALQKLAQAAGVNVGAPSPQTTEYLVRVGLQDALFALEQNANAIGWYDLKTRQALSVMSLVHPEIATDPNARLAFVWALAVTSNGLKVGKNFEIAEQVYRQWKASAKKPEDRRMPDNVGIGTAKNAINKSLALFNTLRDSWGADDVRRFMLTNFTVGEITAIDKALKPGGEHADVTVRGAAILGPKIGNGFFSNLYGNFSALTMDRWLIRTWGRWTGTLIKPMPVQTAKARDRLSAVLQQITADETERVRLSTAINAEITAGMSVDELAVAVQEASVDPAVREVLNQTDTGLELRKAGNSLAKYLDGQKEAPAGPTERKYIREVFGRILDDLRQDPRYAGLTMADLQAVLWYAEKRLYESAKQDLADDDTIEGYSDDEAPDYANAAAEVARKAGVSDRRITFALNKEANRGRPADARPGDGAEGSQAVTGQQEPAAGFTRQDKKFFIGARAVLRVRSNRDGAGQSSGAYTRAGDGGRGKARVLKALGVSYVEEWKLSRSAKTVFTANNLAAPVFLELAPGDATNAQRFADAITTSKQASGAVGAAVYVYPTADYAGMRLFLAKDGKSGFALKPDGDIVSVFSQGGAGRAVMELAVSAGGKKLDAFDTILPEFYSAHGFVAVSRLTWDDSQAPEGWDKAALARYNNGEPDVVFMVYDPTFTGGYAARDGKRFEGETAYGDAVANQQRAVRRVARETRQRARAARQAAQQAPQAAPPTVAPGTLQQGPRGTFNPATLELVLNPNADLSTWFHETGHFFLEVLADVASQPDAPAQIAEDYAKVLAWFGVTPEQWASFTLDEKRPYHERWAESIEQYVMEGKAPSVELQPVMRRFAAWLKSVYQSIKQFVAGRPGAEQQPLNDDIRRVMDRMLATDEQIAQANEVAGLMPDEQADGEAAERLQKRSIADLKWAVKARDKVIAKLKREAREIEKTIRAQVTAEVDQRPEVLAKAAIEKAEKEFEADPVSADMNIAAIADAFSYPSVDAMYRAIELFGDKREAIDGLVEQRMLEEHGDLIDERAIQQAANEAVHNEARARSLATELRTQQEMLSERADTGQVNARGARMTVNVLVEAAKQFGANVIASTPLKDLRATAWKHTAAERRAGKRWTEATMAGDTQAAVQAKQDQMLNNAAAKAALEATAESKKILEFFARVTKGNDEKTVEKGRDPDIVNAARAVLAAYGVQSPASKGAAAYLEVLQKNDPDTYNAIAPMMAAATQNAQPLEALTFEELQGLHEQIRAMWFLAKRSRQMEVDGNLLDIDDVAQELFARMEEIGIPDRIPGEGMAVTRAEERGLFLKQGIAFLRRVEQWAEGMDGKYGGPFLRFVFQPIKDAADRYRKDRIEYRKRFQALVDNLAPIVGDSVIEAPEFGYTFGTPGSTAGTAMNEILHAIAHTGNESNKRKLLLGRGWATENPDGTLNTTAWDAFIRRLVNEGKLEAAHFDFVQGVWDLLEDTKPLAQKAHRDAFGRFFSEVTADAFVDPFGVTRRGGYVPAQVDTRLVKDNALRKLAEEENNSMAFAFPQPAKGFTMARTEYNRPLMLDQRSLSQHLDKVLLFSHMTNPARDVRKLITRKTVSQPLDRIQPAAIESMLQPWLQRSAQQIVETPIVGTGKWARLPGLIRARAGMALMFANVSNAVQQITGLSTAAVRVKPSMLMRSVAQYVANPVQFSRAVWDASPYMDDRAKNEVAVLNEQMQAILLKPSTFERAQDFSMRHAYFLQTALDNVLSPIVWTGAFNQALADGLSNDDAIRFADSTVRQTQGSTLPEDVSRLETGPAYARVFTQFVGYFNMMANTNGTALKQLVGEVGLKKGAGRALYIVMMGFMVPIWVAEAIALAFRGGPEDEDDDGYLDDWLAEVFGMGTVKGLLAQIPIAGQFAVAGMQRFNDNPLDDRVSLSPAVSLLESSVGAPQSVYKAIVEDGSAQKAIRDVATLVSVATGVPVYGLARPIGYAAGVAQDRIEPEGPADLARGLITGTASPESRAP